MKTYDLRNAGGNCINNPAIALVDVLAKREEEVKIIVKKSDIPAKIIEEVAKAAGYAVVNIEEDEKDVTAVLKMV